MAKTLEGGIVVLTEDQLRGIVADAVQQTLAKCGPRDGTDVMDSDKCAALVGVHVKTLAKLINEDGLPTLRNVGKLRRFSRRAVLAWLDQRRTL